MHVLSVLRRTTRLIIMGRKKENNKYSMFEYNEETKKSKCLMEGCDHFIKGNHGANLLRHFFSQHRAKYDEIKKRNSENKENMPEQPSRKAKSVMECCTKLVAIHGRPFSLLEDEAFKELLQMIPAMSAKEQQTINSKNIKENIREKAYEVRSQISKKLQNCLLALKVDVASIKLRRFLGLNVQYISNGKIVLRNLSVVELHSKNTADYLKENITMTLSRYGIELSQILSITTDNGANMLSMVRKIDDSISELVEESMNEPEESDEMDGEEENLIWELDIETDNVVRKVQSVRCAAHCLQLAVQDACQSLEGYLDQLRTPNMAIKLKQQSLPQAVIDMPVRWDSTANMLESLKKLKSFCIANLDISSDIWSTLDIYLEILQPCRILSKTLQKEQLNFGDFYISWMRCRHQLTQIEDPFAECLQSAMINRQNNLFENDQYLAAIYLDPRVNSVLTTVQTTRARTILNKIYKRIVQLNVQESQAISVSPRSEPGTSRQELSNVSNFDNYLRQQFAHNANTLGLLGTSVANSLERELNYKLVEFLNEPILSPGVNVLEYWEQKKITDPYLFNLAKVVLATPPTSVSVERLFSSLKFVLSNLRMSLNDLIIEDIMLVRNNHLYNL